jgi:hypothetical protein
VSTLTQLGAPEMIIQSVGNVAPFDRNSLLKNDSDDMHEDLTFQPVQYWLNRRAIRSTIVMPIDQVKKMKANQKATGSAEDDKREFLSTFTNQILDLIQPKWSEALTTRELEENIDAIGMTVFDSDARAHSYFEGGPDPTMFERFRQKYYSNFFIKL